jgi:hypothetical protein
MTGQLNFFMFKNGDAVTFHTAEDLYPGFVDVDTATMRIKNSVNGSRPDGIVANEYISGALNVTVYKLNGLCNMYFDADGTVGQKVIAGNRGQARGVHRNHVSGDFGVIVESATSGLTGKVWLNGLK